MSVTNPGNQSNVSGTAITALGRSATDSPPSATLTWSATGAARRAGHQPATGLITGTPTAAGTYPVTVTATDSCRLSRLGQLHLDHHQHRVR